MDADGPQLDVAILGGGIAGLWALDTLSRTGYRSCLFERDRLGRGQTLQAQGIIHGGGKYALRGVADVAAMRAIREMPERWRSHVEGTREPLLSRAALLSQHCDLWLPRAGWRDRLLAWGLRPLLKQPGVLAARPRELRRDAWPAALADARAVLRMAEPVVATGTVLADLAAHWPGRVHCNSGNMALRVAEREVEIAFEMRSNLRARCVVLCAGAGNADLLAAAGFDTPRMQLRPLRMFLLRGRLPELNAHCVSGGKTRLTITSADFEGGRVWQVGGELAERCAGEERPARLREFLATELRACLPSLPLSELSMSSYAATRAEAADAGGRRPSGVHLAAPHACVMVAWPTKLALAPVLAEEIAAQAQTLLGAPGQQSDLECTHAPPEVAPYPWEECQWERLS
jgi:glycine/D-amino acid oxidase-like deaminating enzyme